MNERNFDKIAIQQAERDLKIAEFYLNTGCPEAARFYLELVMRRSSTAAPRAIVQSQLCPSLPPARVLCTVPTPTAMQFVPPPPPPPLVGRQIVPVQAIEAQPRYMPPAIVHVADCTVTPPALKHAHLVTPDFEAHCARMHHRGDVIVLEGDVLLLCKKHAQPIRVEAQRIIVNMKDGTFTVDSEAQPTVSGFGVMRTSAVRPTQGPEVIILSTFPPIERP